MERVGPDLSDCGVGRLRIDGSGNIHTQFFTAESTPRPPRVFIHTAGHAQRLGEHALHTWDIAVALDPSATVHEAALILDSLPGIAEYGGKPTDDTLTVAVETDFPSRRFQIELRADTVQLTPGDGDTGKVRLRLPAEALVRLVYGRLDSDHTPATVESENVELDTLRRAFPGL